MSKLTLIVLVQNLKIRKSQGTFIFDDGGISDEWVKHWLFNQLSSIQEKSEVSQWLNVSPRKMRADPWSKQPAQQYLWSTAPHPQNDLFPTFFLITKLSPGLSQGVCTAQIAWLTTAGERSTDCVWTLWCHFAPISTQADWQTWHHRVPAASDGWGLYQKCRYVGPIMFSPEPGNETELKELKRIKS